MSWYIYALIAWFFTGTSFLLLRNVPSSIINSPINITIYTLSFFVIAGIISFIGLNILNLQSKNNVVKQIKKYDKLNMLGIAISIILGYITLMVSTNEGGGALAIQIANLNIIIAVLGGYLFFNDKLNMSKMIGILVCLFGASILIFS